MRRDFIMSYHRTNQEYKPHTRADHMASRSPTGQLWERVPALAPLHAAKGQAIAKEIVTCGV